MDYAAHIKTDEIQTVEEHCRNTAAICGDYCASFGGNIIGQLQGLLHDAGKLSGSFDNYIRGNSSAKRGEIDHSYAGAKYISEAAEKEQINAALLIARTIISHHGLHDWVDEKCSDYFSERVSKNTDYDVIKDNIRYIFGEDAIGELLQQADAEYRQLRSSIKAISKKSEDCAFYLGMLERLFQSALIDADRTDTAWFMNGDPVSDYIDTKELWKNMQEKMQSKLAEFSDRKDAISVQRRSISDRCAEFARNDVKVCRMIVPTGGGKTLSSLRFAVDYCAEHDMKRIIYTAPFMSILEQNSDEIRSIAGEHAFTEHHSNALAELDEQDNYNEYREYELHTERWDSPVIATTMVQLLNTLFSAKTSAVRRMHRLSRAVIIIDEVQSIPLKCVNMFNLAVNFLTNICGASVVLCSATQPVSEETDYPMLIDENSSMTGDYNADFEVFRRTEIVPRTDPYGYSFDEAAEFCFEKFTEAGNLLVIVNTKSAALSLYERIRNIAEDDTCIVHLSTNMCPEHRRNKIELIKQLLKAGRPVICVTTQLIEAGVDISFRCVVRSLAGLDNAAQAAGRCNRHGEAGELRPVYLIKLKEEKLGNLREISTSQGITQQMIDSGRYTDLQSPEAITDYFRSLYEHERGALSYNVTDCGNKTTLLKLLSLNKERYEVSGRTSSKFCSQAFRTAGSIFEVIDNCTLDVIVPYNNEAKQLISRLEAEEENKSRLLRKTQKYTVSVYAGTERRLSDNNAIRILKCGAAILEECCYNDECGVKIDGAEKEIMIF